MQYQKLTNDQKSIRNWRAKRNSLIGQIMADNPMITNDEALKMANKIMRSNKAKPPKKHDIPKQSDYRIIRNDQS